MSTPQPPTPSKEAMDAATKLHPQYSTQWWNEMAQRQPQYQSMYDKAQGERLKIAVAFDECFAPLRDRLAKVEAEQAVRPTGWPDWVNVTNRDYTEDSSDPDNGCYGHRCRVCSKEFHGNKRRPDICKMCNAVEPVPPANGATPRTDSEVYFMPNTTEMKSPLGSNVSSKFARTLERELNEQRRQYYQIAQVDIPRLLRDLTALLKERDEQNTKIEELIKNGLERQDAIEADRDTLRLRVAELEQKQPINTHVRLFDLVRQQRAELHAADLITEEEYAWLSGGSSYAQDAHGGSPSPRRLEDYDKLRATITALQIEEDGKERDTLRSRVAELEAGNKAMGDSLIAMTATRLELNQTISNQEFTITALSQDKRTLVQALLRAKQGFGSITAFDGVPTTTDCEQYFLWRDYAHNSDKPRNKTLKWEQYRSGWLITVGHRAKMPCCISVNWAKIEGYLVMFWYSCSQVTDSVKAEKWTNKNFGGKYDNGARKAMCDANNFRDCISAIEEAKKQSLTKIT